ncbi:MAG: 50S ribosomal protein L25 [Phycisphaerae bacterium]
MHSSKIQAEPREPGSRNANRRLRESGMLPAVIYGHNETPEHVAVSRHDLDLALEHQAHVVELVMGETSTQYLIKDVQYDHLYKNPQHMDLLRVDANERVEVKVALHFIGTPKGVGEGGELVTLLQELDIECPALSIPDDIRVSLNDLGMDETIHVGDLKLPEGVKALQEDSESICFVREKKEAEEPVAGEEGADGAEPEVITKGKAEEEGDEA